MTDFSSFGELALHLGEMELLQHEADHNALERCAELIEKRAKEKIGEYQEQAGPFIAWAELADATKADREHQGFPENEPLLRKGELRDSIEHIVIDDEAHVGSNSDVAVFQELGTAKMPPRSFLGGAAVEKLPRILGIVGGHAVAALVGQGVHGGRIEIGKIP
jgi:hypothetical protein